MAERYLYRYTFQVNAISHDSNKHMILALVELMVGHAGGSEELHGKFLACLTCYKRSTKPCKVSGKSLKKNDFYLFSVSF